MKMRKVLSMLLATLMLLTMIPLGAVSVSAADYEYAMFPMQYLKITQGVNGSFSHQGTKAIDLAGKDSGIDSAYAPFTGTVKRIYKEYVVWLESSNPVVFADGTIDYMTIMVMHDNDTSDLTVGQVIRQGERFFEEGTAGYATGNHIHLECAKGKYTGWYENSYGQWTQHNSINPYDALHLSSTTVILADYGYNWRYVNQTPITYSSIEAGTYLLKNNGLQQYANVDSAIDANKQNINIGDLGVWEGQVWASMEYEIKPSTTTAGYSMRPLCSGSRVVNVYGDTVSNGNNVCIWEDTGHNSQRWQFEKVSGGYVIRNVQNPNCVLDIQNDYNVCVYNYVGAPNQIWSIQNTVAYNANGGTDAPDRQFKNYGEPLTLSSTIPTKDGYLFVGWATSANATTAQYTAGSTYTANANATLYAVWKKECNHIYDSDQDPSCNICGAIREVEIPTDAPAFVVEDAKATYGNTFTVTIRTQNNPGVVGLRLRVQYDSDLLDLISAEEGAFVGVTYGPLDSVPFVFTWCDAIHPDNVTNDVVVRLTFCAKEGTDPTETVISLFYDQADVYNSVWEDVYFSTVSGTVQLTNVIPGDMNNDGNVNVRDLGLLQQHLNGWDVNIVLEACDVNADGNVNVRDLGLFQQYLNGWSVELK